LPYMRSVVAHAAYPDELCLQEAPGQARLSRILSALDIAEIPLLPDFQEVMREDGTNLYQTDMHWSPAGHSLAAEVVLSELIKQGLLRAPVVPALTTP
jgi:hypothetical protein